MAGVPPLEHHPLFHWCWGSPLGFEHYRTEAVCDTLLFLLPPIYLFKWLQRVLNSSHPLCRLLPAQQQLHSLTSTLPHTPPKLPWLCSPVCPCSLLSCMMALSLLFSASVIHSIHLCRYGLFQHIPQGQSVHTHPYKAALTLQSAHCGAARHNLVQFLLNYIQPKISPRVNVRWSCGIMLHFIQYLVFHFIFFLKLM